MTQIDKDRFFSMAEAYDKMTSYLVPRYDAFQAELVELLFADGAEDKFIVDLGAGSGILLDKILARSGSARCCWVDYSEDFLAVAKGRLASHGDRVQYVLVPLEQSWQDQLADRPDAICSMSAIHHLTPADKKELYCRCHSLLKPGGWLFNFDEMSAESDDAYMNTLRYWVRYVERAKETVPDHLQPYCREWCERFESWQARNIDNANLPKQKGDDIHQGSHEQMHWLRETGFADVDLFVKFQLWSLIGGRKK